MSKLFLVSALAVSLWATSGANAASRAVLVSSGGSDTASCGTAAAPCQTINYALGNVVAPGDEILVSDPAYVSGPLTINGSVSIINTGGTVTISQGSANYGVRISAHATGRVVLKGLTIDGANVGTLGVDVLSAGSVDIIDCLVKNFSSDGIRLEPNTPLQYDIKNTAVLDNGVNGIYVIPRSGGSATGSIVNSDVHRSRSGYGGIAINAGTGVALAHIINTRSNFNAGVGFAKIEGGSFYLAASTATGNSNNVGSFGGGGPGYSYQNNFLLGNTSDSGTGFLTTVTQQ